jgi:hypothetical protein
MSYFKPLNSNENNLHIIRASFDSTGNLINPSSNQLPSSFSYTKITGSITLNYPNIFNSSDIPVVFIEANSSTIHVTNKTSTSCIINTSTLAFDVFILGTKANGPVFAVSNRGWKYTNNQQSNDIIYSDMLVGINNDNPHFNLTLNGTLGILPNQINSSSINSNQIVQNTINVINLDSSNTLQMSSPSNNGELLYLFINSISNNGSTLTIDITSNLVTSVASNIVLQKVGDSVSLYSYNSKWLVYNTNIGTTKQNVLNYNILNASSYDFNVVTNGYLTVMTIDQYLTLDLPVNSNYNGYVIDMVISNIASLGSNINFVLSNITTNKNSLTLSNISDHVKLLCTGNKWLQIN